MVLLEIPWKKSLYSPYDFHSPVLALEYVKLLGPSISLFEDLIAGSPVISNLFRVLSRP